MLQRGVEWAATGAVTIEGPDRRGERRFLPWPYYNRKGDRPRSLTAGPVPSAPTDAPCPAHASVTSRSTGTRLVT